MIMDTWTVSKTFPDPPEIRRPTTPRQLQDIVDGMPQQDEQLALDQHFLQTFPPPSLAEEMIGRDWDDIYLPEISPLVVLDTETSGEEGAGTLVISCDSAADRAVVANKQTMAPGEVDGSLIDLEMTEAFLPHFVITELINDIHERHNTLSSIYAHIGPAHMAPLRAVNINMEPQIEAELALAYVTLQAYTNLAKIFPELTAKFAPVFIEILNLCRALREQQQIAEQ